MKLVWLDFVILPSGDELWCSIDRGLLGHLSSFLVLQEPQDFTLRASNMAKTIFLLKTNMH